MKTIFRNARIVSESGELVKRDIVVIDGTISAVAAAIKEVGDREYDLGGKVVIPGAIDVHAHLREPGFEYKETVLSGTRGAAKGGIVAIMSMPNLNPVPDCVSSLDIQRKIIERDAIIDVYPFASVTVGEKGERLSDLAGLAPYVHAYSDDGKGVNDLGLLREAMIFARDHGKVIASHAEKAGYGTTREAEILAVKDELELLKDINCPYHFCHLSTEESWAMVRQAKKDGLDVTAEATPHHIYFTLDDAKNGNYKMNPPLRMRRDLEATLRAVADGTCDMLATDHAPHAPEEKEGDYAAALNGIIGFETMLPVAYTKLVKSGLIDWNRFIALTSVNPAKRFSIPCTERVAVGERADFAVMDIDTEREYTKEEILSRSVNSPFIGEKLWGYNVLTVKNGDVIYEAKL